MKNVKEMIMRAKEMLRGKIGRITMATTSILTGVAVNTYALPSEDGVTMASNLLNQILTYVQVAGGFIAAFGIISYVLAYKNSNSEQQSNAAMFAVVGFALCSVRPILSAVGVI